MFRPAKRRNVHSPLCAESAKREARIGDKNSHSVEEERYDLGHNAVACSSQTRRTVEIGRYDTHEQREYF